MDITLKSFMAECEDALMSIAYTNNLDEHITITKNFLSLATVEPEAKNILSQILKIFERLNGIDPMIIAVDDDLKRGVGPILKQVTNYLDQSDYKRFIYHGTIRGRLASIEDNGLIPGYKKVWKNEDGIRNHSDKGVFFSYSWRSAMNWSESAHAFSRGPKKGWFRTQVVIRIPINGMELYKDGLARTDGNVAHKGIVPAKDSYVLITPVKGIPVWIPISEAKRRN